MTSPSPEMPLPERPPLTIAVGDTEIKMTYGLEMDLRRMLPDPITALQLIQNDPTTQDYVVRRILTPKKKTIFNIDELISIEELEIDSEDVERILGWATEHALYFFVRRTLEMAKLGVRYETALPKPSSSGSETSASSTPSAGPSE